MASGVLIDCANGRKIAVDLWKRSSHDALGHFLTHCHADHTEGLNDRWTGSRLYCSSLSCAIIKMRWPQLVKRCVPLPVGDTVTLTLHPRSTGRNAHLSLKVKVTLIDAQHCPGAVMFLFEGDFGRVLHTGDFRWESNVQAGCRWHHRLIEAPIDLLYLDNTYCQPGRDLPTRLEAAQQLHHLLLAHPHHDVVIGVDTLGKGWQVTILHKQHIPIMPLLYHDLSSGSAACLTEELLASAAAARQQPIGLSPERCKVFRLAGVPEHLFCEDTRSGRLRAVPRWRLTAQYLARLNRIAPTLGVVASGWTCSHSAKESEDIADSLFSSQDVRETVKTNAMHIHESQVGAAQGETSTAGAFDLAQYSALLRSIAALVAEADDVATPSELAAARKLLHAVPYSLHCSFKELRAFVSWLRPRAVCGIVKGTSTGDRCADPAVHFAGLLRGRDPTMTSRLKRHPLDVEQRGAISTWQAAHAGALEVMQRNVS